MKKSVLFLFIVSCVFIIKSTSVKADDIAEFQTQATIINNAGAKTYEINNSGGSSYNTDDANYNLPSVSATSTIPYGSVIYGDSISSAHIAKKEVVVDSETNESQEIYLYTIKYNNTKYLVSSSDVSQFKLIDTEIVENQVTTDDNTQTEDNNPKTGMTEVVVTWVVAGLSLTFTIYYFIRYTKFA